SGKHLGALFGLMNSLGVPGALGSQLFLGRFVDWLGGLGYSGRPQWDPALYVYAAVLVAGAACWLFIDATRPVVGDRGPSPEITPGPASSSRSASTRCAPSTRSRPGTPTSS